MEVVRELLDPEVRSGGSPQRRRQVVSGWVSTGRKVTVDGASRTVYRDPRTGAKATKRLVTRNGVRSARYRRLIDR